MAGVADPGGTRQSQSERLKSGKAASTNEPPPSPAYLTWLHALAPIRDDNDVHHRNGTDPGDSSPGPHRHRGSDKSFPLWDSNDAPVTGDLANLAGQRTAIKGILRLLGALGAVDGTTN